MELRTDQIITAYESQQVEHQWFLEEENTCPLCGTALELQHDIDPISLQVEEKGRCPSCKINTKTKLSPLQ